MKAIFMGTPEFAVPSLKRMVDDGHEIMGVFTQPDRPSGRGYKLIPPPIKALAAEICNAPVYQPEKLKKSDAEEIIRTLAPDVIVVVAYGQMLPKSILDIPRYGCINVHGSLLPAYRGAAPIQWAVINGEAKSGVTTMRMDVGMDTGEILLVSDTEIGPDETAGELYDRLSLVGADCLSETLKVLPTGALISIPQEEKRATFAPMLKKELGAIDFARPTRELHNLIRGLSPWPGAFTALEGKRLKVHAARPALLQGAPGTLLSENALIIGTGDGSIELLEVQLEGAKRITGSELLHGQRLQTGRMLKTFA